MVLCGAIAALELPSISYDFTYTIDGNKLMIDYANESVRDSEYEFTVDGNTLTLIGGEGTVGRTYELSGVCVTRCPSMMILPRNMITAYDTAGIIHQRNRSNHRKRKKNRLYH